MAPGCRPCRRKTFPGRGLPVQGSDIPRNRRCSLRERILFSPSAPRLLRKGVRQDLLCRSPAEKNVLRNTGAPDVRKEVSEKDRMCFRSEAETPSRSEESWIILLCPPTHGNVPFPDVRPIRFSACRPPCFRSCGHRFPPFLP